MTNTEKTTVHTKSRIRNLKNRLQKHRFADTRRKKVCVIIPAFLFSMFMVWGESFAKYDSWELVLGSGRRMLRAGMLSAVYFIVFYLLISAFFRFLDDYAENIIQSNQMPSEAYVSKRCPHAHNSAKRSVSVCYQYAFYRHPFLTPFLTVFIAYLPILFFSYPAVFMADDVCMILQGYNFPDPTSRYLNLIDESVHLNSHHPVVYTMLIHSCLEIGKKLFDSYAVGALLVSATQLLVMDAAISLALCMLLKQNVKFGVIIALMLYYIISPRMQNYMFLMSKDVLFAAALLFFLLLSPQADRNRNHEIRCRIGFVLAGIAVGLLRNDGKYVLFGTFVIFVIVLAKQRKRFLTAGVAVIGVLLLYSNVLLPALHITPSGKREMLSVPFQQTARYVRDYGDELTDEEREAIGAVLDIETIGENYEPSNSDPVKNTFRETATDAEVKAYFHAWLQMLQKHPGVYLQATMNNYYRYFYPCGKLASYYSYSWSDKSLNKCINSKYLSTIGFNIEIPKVVREWSLIYEIVREFIFSIPVLSLLKNSAAYVWALILLFFYLLAKKQYKTTTLLVPCILCLCIALLGPRNGEYFRYLFGMAVCLPVLWMIALTTQKKTVTCQQNDAEECRSCCFRKEEGGDG